MGPRSHSGRPQSPPSVQKLLAGPHAPSCLGRDLSHKTSLNTHNSAVLFTGRVQGR